MTLQDLKDNRERIIRKILFQCKTADIKAVMTKMVTWLNSRQDIKDMRPTMASIDKFTYMVTVSWIKHDSNLTFTEDEYRERLDRKNRESHSTFY